MIAGTFILPPDDVTLAETLTAFGPSRRMDNTANMPPAARSVRWWNPKTGVDATISVSSTASGQNSQRIPRTALTSITAMAAW